MEQRCHIECGTVVCVLQKPAPTVEISANSLTTHQIEALLSKNSTSSLVFKPLFTNFTGLLRYMQPLSWEIGFLGCRFQLFGLYLPSKQSHYCGNQQKLRTLQESFTPVQSFAAETYFILIMITKGPQLVLKTNILLLIPGWWRLCTDIRTGYACVCANEPLHL